MMQDCVTDNLKRGVEKGLYRDKHKYRFYFKNLF